MFKVAGLSRHEGSLKLRFANDIVSRVKVLQRNGHKDIELVELPQAMTKDAAVAYLATLEQFAYIEAQAVFADYQSKNEPKEPKRKVAVAPKEEAAAEDTAGEETAELTPEEKAQAKRERDAARKREARAKAKAAKLDEAVTEEA